MIKMTLSMMMMMMVSMVLMNVCTMISMKMKTNREKMTPFECGFDPKSSARMPFSIQFFLIAVLFLIFDIEVAIMLPTTVTMKTAYLMSWSYTIVIFLMTLILGLYYEWKNNMLEWSK